MQLPHTDLTQIRDVLYACAKCLLKNRDVFLLFFCQALGDDGKVILQKYSSNKMPGDFRIMRKRLSNTDEMGI